MAAGLRRWGLGTQYVADNNLKLVIYNRLKYDRPRRHAARSSCRMPMISVPAASAPTKDLSACQLQLIEFMSSADSGWSEPKWRQDLESWRKTTAEAVYSALRRQKSTAELDVVETMLTNLAHCGANDFAVAVETLTVAQAYAKQGWAGLAAATILAPAWQATFLPKLKETPLWLMPLYAAYVFSAPKLLTSEGQAESYARVYVSALDGTLSLVEANRGSAVTQAVLARFRAVEDSGVLTLDPAVHTEIRIKRARIVTALNRQPPQIEPLTAPRSGRALRLGVVARSIGDTASALSLVKMLERLPIIRFSISLLVERSTDSNAERQLKDHGALLIQLGGEIDEVARSIQDANFDVAVFLPEEPWLGNPIAELLLRRLAPVQIVHDWTGLPSGFPHADCYIASPAASPTRGEKGMLVALAGCVGPGETHVSGGAEIWTRATIGMEDASCVFGYFGELVAITPEVVATWSRLLSAAPGSRLVIVAPPVLGCRVDRFCTALAVQLEQLGVASGRVAVFGDVSLATHEERKAAFAAIDVLLDATPAANGDTGYAGAAAGCPMVSWAEPNNSAAALLRQMGLSELVAANADDFIAAALKLATDVEHRKQVSSALSAASPLLIQYDSFALGESTAQLIESAYDQILDSRKKFRAESKLLQSRSHADVAATLEAVDMFIELGSIADAEMRLRSLLFASEGAANVRRRLATILSKQGQPAEAADLLVTVVELAPDDPEVWLELGLAARQAGKANLAVQALQTGVRVDASRVESWQLLAELAREVGNADLLEQIQIVLASLGVERPAAPSLESLHSSLAAL